MNETNTDSRSKGIARIFESVSKLIKPSLAPLYQEFLDRKKIVADERTSLLRRLEEVRQEGFEAAVRLRLSCNDNFRIERGSYFERIEQKE